MNKACSAGTGSFLEEQGVFFGIHDIQEFSNLAQQADAPPELGQMCTVHVAEAAAEASNEGFEVNRTVALLVDADGSGTISPGDTLRYTITYTNTGASAVTEARVMDRFDDTFLEPPFNISSGGTVSNGIITWNVGTVAAGASGEVPYASRGPP